MAYSTPNQRANTRLRQDDSLVTRNMMLGFMESSGKFHEFEPAIVLDVIHDNDHDVIQTKKANPADWPLKGDGKPHTDQDPDYSYVGRIKVRLIYSEQGVDPKQLNWAIPLDQNQEELPLRNEIVNVIKIMNHYYYTKTINIKNMPHHNADYRYEERYGLHKTSAGTAAPNTTYIYNSKGGGRTHVNSTVANGQGQYLNGQLGEHYTANDLVRPLKRFEGDKVYESRFGSSIRMGAYGTTTVPNSSGEPVSFKGVDAGIGDTYQGGKGNPQILIRNGQNPAAIKGKGNIFNYRITEDINNDGSAIHITSGRTISKWKTTVSKTFFQSAEHQEEQTNFSPGGATSYVFPKSNFDSNFDDKKYLIGDQIIVNSDRIILQSKTNEMMLFSKRRFGIITDDEVAIDAHQQMVLTSNTKTVLNAPFIFLGEYNQTKEPALLGQTTIDWLYALCEVLKAHTHWYIHTHPQPGTSGPEPNVTQQPFDSYVQQLIDLQQKLPLLCSNRVFVTGGGNAPGSDGGSVQGDTEPGTVGKTPGGYFVPKPGEYAGKISPSNVGGMVGPFARANALTVQSSDGQDINSITAPTEATPAPSPATPAQGSTQGGTTTAPSSPSTQPTSTSPASPAQPSNTAAIPSNSPQTATPTGYNSIQATKTQYGYADDLTPDSNSAAGIGAFHDHTTDQDINLTQNGVALSATSAQQLNAKPGDIIQTTDSQGNTQYGIYQDIAPEPDNRVDFYTPQTTNAQAEAASGPITAVNLGGGSSSPTQALMTSQQARVQQLQSGTSVVAKN